MDGSPSASPTFEVDPRGIGWITFDDPDRRANVLTEPVMERLALALTEARSAAADDRIEVVVVRSGKSGSFIVGADVDAIAEITDAQVAEARIREGQAIYMELETLPVPTVAAIHGTCMGGGTELSLACTHRVVSDDDRTKIGLPEVQLGILPAWGGTTRLPRLIGLRPALDLLLTGKPMNARKAERVGFAGQVVPADLFEEAVADFALGAKDLPAGSSLKKRGFLARMVDDTSLGRRVVLATARKKVKATTGGHYPAPMTILDLLSDHLGSSVQRSLDAEARLAAELVTSDVSKNLIHVFHMREAARKGLGVATDVRERDIDTLGVVGAGVMGGGIAQLAAFNGIRVRIKDIRHEAVASGLQHARQLFDKAVERHKLRHRDAAQMMERISGGVDYSGFSACDLVVEAVVERMDVKRAVLAELEEQVAETCVLATNTSSLSVDLMAGALGDPTRFCGMHFFNPVHKMPLIEVVRGAATDDTTIATTYALALRFGKVPVVVKDGPGFLVNRILGPYLNEAGFLLDGGASIEDVDRAAKRFGMPMGPLRLVDEVGIDVSRHAGTALHDGLGDRFEPSRALSALGETDRLGRKGGRGFYVYENGKEQRVDDSVYSDIGGEKPDRAGAVSNDEIERRLVYQMINEAARILDDGIVRTAADVDLGMIMGTGFPPFLGGLLRYADALGVEVVLGGLRDLAEAHGLRFQPAPALERLAKRGETFYEAFAG